MFASGDADIVGVSDTGVLIPGVAGTTYITATAYGLTIATAVSNDAEPAYNLQFFPESYVLQPDETRQFLVRRNIRGQIFELSSANDGTAYFVEDPTIGSITGDGLFAPLSSGTTVVTVVHDGVSLRVPVRVATPSGATVVDSAGGLFDDGTGIVVGIASGATAEALNVSIARMDETDFAAKIPAHWQYGAAFKIDLGVESLNTPVSLEIPAPSFAAVGDVGYLLREVEVVHEDGSIEIAWELVDSLQVQADGNARTTSPPNVGAFGRHRRSPVIGH